MAHEAVETPAGRSPETVDRLLVGICGAIWLVLLAAGVFATVALVRLGSGHAGGGEHQSSWLLYSIIVVSALVILGAIPLLLRARRGALAENARDGAAEESVQSAEAPVHRPEHSADSVRVFGVDPYARREADAGSIAARRAYHALVDRIWLRGTTALLGVMGLALTAVAVGTYLLADTSDTAAWVAFGLAGALAISMVAVLAYFNRQLDEVVEAGE